MKKRKHLWALFAAGVAGLTLPSCDNTDLAVPGEPEGPIQVTRVTLLTNGDTTLRETQVFSDTSAPALCQEGQDCIFTTTRDLYGARLSPINPDSANQIRVVFNKLPLLVDGMELETAIYPPVSGGPDGSMDTTLPPTSIKLNYPDAAKLTSPDNCGVPPMTLSVSLTGTDKSPSPVDIPYGPALQLAVSDADDEPLAALEPACSYQITLHDGLAGRDGKPWDKSTAKFLTFTTEGLRILQAGTGDDDNDTWYPTAPTEDETSVTSVPSPSAVDIGDVPKDGALRLKFNAPLFDQAFAKTVATATVGGKAIEVLITTYTDATGMSPSCDPGNGRSLFIAPVGGSWGDAAGPISITLDGSKLFALAQPGTAPSEQNQQDRKAAKASLGGTVTITANNTGMAADMKYTGVKAADLVPWQASCNPRGGTDGGDMGNGSGDMGNGSGDMGDMTNAADMTNPPADMTGPQG